MEISVGMRPVQPPVPLEEMAAETVALLQAAGVQLAIAEAGTDGAVAQVLRAAGGQAALTHARLFGSAEVLAIALRVSPAKVDAFGAASAMVAAEAAAELIDTYEGGWGLVVMAAGNRGEPGGVQGMDDAASGCYIALGAPSTTVVQQSSPDRVVRTVLELLNQQARQCA